MTRPALDRRDALRTAAAVAATVALPRRAVRAETDPHEDFWPSLSTQIFGDRPIQDGQAVVAIDAPYRAEDAAVVPVTLRTLLASTDAAPVRVLTLVIDENPSPLVARIEIGPDSGVDVISSNVRVNAYTDMHVVAERADGGLFATKRFVKAAGGCSAPAVKQQGGTIALGTMRFRVFPPDQSSGHPEAQLMIRHPNASGMQMDQLTRLYIPAHFIQTITLWQGDQRMLAIQSGISVAENPEFRFAYRPNGAKMFRAEAQDSQGKAFSAEWPVAEAS